MRQLKRNSRGFSLLEVMITLVILLFGLLGIAGLMAKGQRASMEAFQRQQALALADDMAERIRSNPGLYDTYANGAPVTAPLGVGEKYDDYRQGSITDCSVLSCDPTAVSAYDLALWDGLLNGYYETQVGTGNRVGGIISAQGCVEDIDATPPICGGVGSTISHSLRVSVAWQGNDESVAPTQTQCGAGHYDLDTKRRVISIEVMVLQKC